MNKIDFLRKLEDEIQKMLSPSSKLVNNINQALAWKLNARFNRTFDEHYLWSQSLYLSTSSCMLLSEDKQNKIAINGLYESAKIYENLGKLTNAKIEYDKDYFLILSALCYDLAGYQANAFCIADTLQEYKLTSTANIDVSLDNIVIEQISLVLTKRIPQAKNNLDNDNHSKDDGYELFKFAMLRWYNYILKQEESDYLSSIP